MKQSEWVTAIGEKQPNRRVLKSLMDEGGRPCVSDGKECSRYIASHEDDENLIHLLLE